MNGLPELPNLPSNWALTPATNHAADTTIARWIETTDGVAFAELRKLIGGYRVVTNCLLRGPIVLEEGNLSACCDAIRWHVTNTDSTLALRSVDMMWRIITNPVGAARHTISYYDQVASRYVSIRLAASGVYRVAGQEYLAFTRAGDSLHFMEKLRRSVVTGDEEVAV